MDYYLTVVGGENNGSVLDEITSLCSARALLANLAKSLLTEGIVHYNFFWNPIEIEELKSQTAGILIRYQYS
jgi:hypothetical protein